MDTSIVKWGGCIIKGWKHMEDGRKDWGGEKHSEEGWVRWMGGWLVVSNGLSVGWKNGRRS